MGKVPHPKPHSWEVVDAVFEPELFWLQNPHCIPPFNDGEVEAQ